MSTLSRKSNWGRISLYNACSYFHDKRESCIEIRYLTRINVFKFKEIISSKTQSKLRKLCQLIRNINSSLLPPV